jgi:hypothetical protein
MRVVKNITVVSPQAALIVTSLLGMHSAFQLLAGVPYFALRGLLLKCVSVH